MYFSTIDWRYGRFAFNERSIKSKIDMCLITDEFRLLVHPSRLNIWFLESGVQNLKITFNRVNAIKIKMYCLSFPYA